MSILEETALCTPYLLINNQGQTIQFNLDNRTHILGRNPINADLKVNPDWDMVSRIQATLYKEGNDYRIYDGDGKNPSTNRL
ncbi:FHA domain-containing protein, partial [Cylindrospermopsis raciborskii]